VISLCSTAGNLKDIRIQDHGCGIELTACPLVAVPVIQIALWVG